MATWTSSGNCWTARGVFESFPGRPRGQRQIHRLGRTERASRWSSWQGTAGDGRRTFTVVSVGGSWSPRLRRRALTPDPHLPTVWRRPSLRRSGTRSAPPAAGLVTTGTILLALVLGLVFPRVDHLELFLLFATGPLERSVFGRPAPIPG